MDKQKRIEDAVIELDGVWPDDDSDRILKQIATGALVGWSGEFYPGVMYEHVCTYPEFMEARKRLENRPSWDDAPEWADWLAQDSSGYWEFFHGKPIAMDYCWGPKHTDAKLFYGAIFGDWRQSLEPRPQPDNKEGEGVEWEPGVDLPPVGAECEVTLPQYPGDRRVECKILAHTSVEGVPVAVYGYNNPMFTVDWGADGNFYPIQSHRDKVIEAAMVSAKNECDDYLGIPDCARLVSRLYKDGLLKLPEGEE